MPVQGCGGSAQGAGKRGSTHHADASGADANLATDGARGTLRAAATATATAATATAAAAAAAASLHRDWAGDHWYKNGHRRLVTTWHVQVGLAAAPCLRTHLGLAGPAQADAVAAVARQVVVRHAGGLGGVEALALAALLHRVTGRRGYLGTACCKASCSPSTDTPLRMSMWSSSGAACTR